MRAGQIAHLHATLRKGEEYAFIEVFSSVGDFEPSPHVPIYKMGLKENDRPSMLGATTMRLTDNYRPEQKLEIEADEDCDFYLFQDVDTMKIPLSKGRIRINGRHWIVSALGRLLRLW